MCLGIAGVAKNVEKTNEFIGSVPRDRFTPFGRTTTSIVQSAPFPARGVALALGRD